MIGLDVSQVVRCQMWSCLDVVHERFIRPSPDIDPDRVRIRRGHTPIALRTSSMTAGTT